jgi:IS5 family transposase
MLQQAFASQVGFERYGRKSRRELFLDEMNQVVPWGELQALVEPHYAKAGLGRCSVGLAIMLPDLLHGEERKVWGDCGYQGQTEAIIKAAPNVQDMTCRRTKFNNYVEEVDRRNNSTKSRIRAKVEHVFHILKRVFGFDKVRYRGIAKNHNRLCANFALVNLYLHRKHLATLGE